MCEHSLSQIFQVSPNLSIFTSRNEVVAKVMFLQASVIMFTGGVSASVHVGIPHSPLGADTPQGADTLPPKKQIPPQSRQPPKKQTPPQKADPPRSRLRHTVNEQPVRILLECILVCFTFSWGCQTQFCWSLLNLLAGSKKNKQKTWT